MLLLIRKLLSVVLIALACCLSFPAVVRAEWQAGVEYQLNEDRQGLNTIKADYWALPKYGIRASLDAAEMHLAADLLYRKNPNLRQTVYMGLGIRDLTNKDSDNLTTAEKMELIVGMEARLTARLSLTAEVRVVPLSMDEPGMKPLVGFGLKWITDFGGGWSGRIGPIKDRELDLLARLITAEAGAEPYDGQVAVGAVVLNRIKSGRFPDTIREVIYQDGQFSSLPKLDKQVPSAEALRAAKAALTGADPSLEALYFYNPLTCKLVGLQFFSSPKLKVTAKIGNHVFLKEIE
jgi:hypothetical protein